MHVNREVVTLHFGQAGIQMGNAIWENLITEHGILCNGLKDPENTLANNSTYSSKTFFHDSPSGQYYPRSLIVDTEPTVVDEIRTGLYRQLFHPDLLVSGIEDAANNFARGYYPIGRKMQSNLLEKVRYIIESCDNFKGFLTFSGSGGGTGSGLYSLFIERMMLEYCSKLCIGALVLSGRKFNDCIVEPYNTMLRIGQSMAATDLNLLLDNESLFQICSQNIQMEKPTYSDINRLLAPVFSSITAPFRFDGPVTGDLSEMTTNLVPYPKINFPSLSYSPFMSNSGFDHTLLTSESLTRDVFQNSNNLLNLDISKYKIMASFLIYRGNHHKGTIINALDGVRRNNKYKWVDWCPTGFKVSQSSFPPIQNFPTQPSKSVLMMCNHSGILFTIKELIKKFDMLYRKKCFVHWYVGEGMEYDELEHALVSVMFLQSNYEGACQIENNEMLEIIEKSFNNDRKSIDQRRVVETISQPTQKEKENSKDKSKDKSKSKSKDKSVKSTDPIVDAFRIDALTISKSDTTSLLSEKKPKKEKKKSVVSVTDNVPGKDLTRQSVSHRQSDELVMNNSEYQPLATLSKVKSREFLITDQPRPSISVLKSREFSITENENQRQSSGSIQRPHESDNMNPGRGRVSVRKSNEFVFSDKAKAILMDNLTIMTPDMKQRMLGYTNIE